MPYYEYRATDEDGNELRDVMEAAAPADVVSELAGRKFRANSVRRLKEKGFSLLGRQGKVSADDLVMFNRHLASLVKTDLPLVPGLKALSRDLGKDRLKVVIERIRKDIAGGSSLREAFSRHPGLFSPFYVNMIEAGERSGNLAGILKQLTAYMQFTLHLRKNIRDALVYPACLLAVCLAVVTLSIVMFLPFVRLWYGDMARAGLQPVPAATGWIALALWLGQRGGVAIVEIAAVVGGISALVAVCVFLARRSSAGRFHVDRIKLGIPLIGLLHKNTAMAHFCRTFGTLLTGGIPVMQALDLLQAASPNAVLMQSIRDMKSQVSEGEPIADALSARSIFPQTLVWIASVGEKRGTLDEAFLDLGEHYEKEAARSAQMIQRVLEPIIVVVMALIVLAAVGGVFIPLLRMAGMMGW